MIYVIVGIISICLFIILGYFAYKSIDKKRIQIDPEFEQVYNSPDNEQFEIKGTKNNFVISKDNNIEFLIKDGQIVACRDKRITDDFEFYKGDQHGVN